MVEADALVVSATQNLPIWIATFISARKLLPGHPNLSLKSCGNGAAVICESPDATTTALIAEPGARGIAFEGWSTDADMAVLRLSGSESAYILANGSYIKRSDEEYLSLRGNSENVSIEAAENVLRIRGDVRPPVLLRCGPVGRAIVNGIETPFRRRNSDTVIV